MKQLGILASGVFFVLFALPLSASGCLDQSCDQSTGTICLTSFMPLGQEFVAERRMPLERIDVRMSSFNPGFPATPVVLTLHEDALEGPLVPGGTVTVTPDWLGGISDWVEFVFDEPLQLAAGEVYVFELWTATPRWGLRSSPDDDCYPGGSCYENGILDDDDINFGTFHVCTVSGELVCQPDSGVLPFTVNIALGLTNEYTGLARRMAGNFGIEIAQGTWFGNLRSGFRNVGPGEAYTLSWNQHIPALASLLGVNEFRLLVEDVTPAPFNQPPYPMSGDTDVAACTVTGLVP